MHDLFGFNPQSLSDDELMERITLLSSRIMWAARFGSGDILHALRTQQMAITTEQRERAMRPLLATRAAMPTVLVESDPDLAAEGRKEIEAEIVRNTPKGPARPRPFSITRDRIKPTNRPIAPDEK
jgi:hypothetical protein